MIDAIKEIAIRIMEQRPGVVVRFRLLRDVLKVSSSSRELQEAKENLEQSQCVQELTKEQWADGGWGAFHSMNTRLKKKIPTTEVAVNRAISLGLGTSHSILGRASAYILSIMNGDIDFPDHPEKNDRWQTGKRLFLTSTLSIIDPDHPGLNEVRKLWHEIAKRTFQSGEYNEQDEIDVHAELTGATVIDSYLVLNNKYTLNLLGSKPGILSKELEMALLKWLLARSDGIGYLGIPLNKPPPLKPGPFNLWLASLEILCLYPNWVQFTHSIIEWLWNKRNERGFWDFGPRPSSISFFPLSDNWRSRQNRMIDWTTRILLLLSKHCEEEKR